MRFGGLLILGMLSIFSELIRYGQDIGLVSFAYQWRVCQKNKQTKLAVDLPENDVGLTQ